MVHLSNKERQTFNSMLILLLLSLLLLLLLLLSCSSLSSQFLYFFGFDKIEIQLGFVLTHKCYSHSIMHN